MASGDGEARRRRNIMRRRSSSSEHEASSIAMAMVKKGYFRRISATHPGDGLAERRASVSRSTGVAG